MRKISLTDGRFTVEILPDCGGAIAALRWRAPTGRTFDLLRPAMPDDIARRDFAHMACLPLTPSRPAGNVELDDPPPALAEWTVQDASNIRATLTLQEDAASGKFPNAGRPASYQLLQRFELIPGGLAIVYTITNLGVTPMPARAALRLRIDGRTENILRGPLLQVVAEGAAPSVSELAAGLPLAGRDLRIRLRSSHEISITKPEERLLLTLNLERGLDFLDLECDARRREIFLSPLSHHDTDKAPGCLLQQGDSLSAALRIAGQALTP